MQRPCRADPRRVGSVAPVQKVHVVGHRNPDTDSIAAAISYAELMQRTDPETAYVAARPGDLNPQTEWVLQQAGADEPLFLEHVMPRVKDVMREDFPYVPLEEPVRSAGQLMTEKGVELLPVVGEDGTLAGVLTERVLARRYVRESLGASRLGVPTSAGAIARTLDGRLLTGNPQKRVAGRVWVLAMQAETLLREVDGGDVAVVGDRIDAQLSAIERGVEVLVLTNGVVLEPEVLSAAEGREVAVIGTPLDSYVAGRMITLAAPCRSLIDDKPLTARRDDLVSDVSDEVKDVSYRAAVVVDRDRRPVGLITRADLVKPSPRRVILVDHAETAQAVPGIEQAEIVEIIDHHHIGSIETRLPVKATFDPIGSTCTLISERYEAAGIEPSRTSAICMMAAILSDTVILNSPTTTDRDRAQLERLGDLLDIDPLQFGKEMFEHTADVSGVPADELMGRDAKAYELGGGHTICIAQIETVGAKVLERTDELLEAARKRLDADGHRLVALMVTDVAEHGTHLIVAGDVGLAERAFGETPREGVIPLPGVMSRKKQVAPKLLANA